MHQEDVMHRRGFTVWLTGLPSSGKSTLARLLEQTLGEAGQHVVVLDGDEIRQRLTKGLGFSKSDRDENISRIAYVAKLLTHAGAVTITAAISPYRDARERARLEIGNFVEVYVQCPLAVCMQRDVKGLYAKAVKGEITNLTGFSDPYEPPANPDVVLNTDVLSADESVRLVIEKLVRMTYLPNDVVRHVFKSSREQQEEARVAAHAPAQWSI
jgi:adenylylsulfate kinase